MDPNDHGGLTDEELAKQLAAQWAEEEQQAASSNNPNSSAASLDTDASLIANFQQAVWSNFNARKRT